VDRGEWWINCSGARRRTLPLPKDLPLLGGGTYDLVQMLCQAACHGSIHSSSAQGLAVYSGSKPALNQQKRAGRQVDLPEMEELSDASPGPWPTCWRTRNAPCFIGRSASCRIQREMMALYLDHEFSCPPDCQGSGKSEISVEWLCTAAAIKSVSCLRRKRAGIRPARKGRPR